jgi:oligopeptide/dipeptide ABC transporter ATP-binding protein
VSDRNPAGNLPRHFSSNGAPILEVSRLQTYFFTDDGVVKAVDGVDIEVRPGEIFGLVGESGCGKSVTAFSILRLVDPPGQIVGGEVLFDGRNLLGLEAKEMVSIRGKEISMIFQQPLASLNPVLTIGSLIAEVFEVHEGMNKSEAWESAVELLRLVRIPDPERRAHSYAHEISGGQAQRVMIAMALALRPKLLIADEPTTALDVTIQAQILDLILDMSQQSNTAVILITHDLGVVAEMADSVAVMYAGHVVERADVIGLFDRKLHPYTQGLIASVPAPGRSKEFLDAIPGTVPDLLDIPPGCRFAPRCQARIDYDLGICTEREPDLLEIAEGHYVRCYLYESHGEHVAPLAEKVAGGI